MYLALHFIKDSPVVADHRLPSWCWGPRERGLQSAGTAFIRGGQGGALKAKCLPLMDPSSVCFCFSPKHS